jgi:PAS domain S-box-containing protein
MFNSLGKGDDAKTVMTAMNKSLAIIEFDMAGKILHANENFCAALGYDLSEIKGKHHSMFVDPTYARSHDYKEFWAKLGRGEFDAREYLRFGKGGKEVWIQASYNPIIGRNGKPYKVVKFASDITEAKQKSAEDEGKIAAISRAQADHRVRPAGQHPDGQREFLRRAGLRPVGNQGQTSLDVRRTCLCAQRRLQGFLGQAARRRVRRRGIQAARQGWQGDLDPGFLQPDHGPAGPGDEGGQVRHGHHGPRFRR